MYKTIIFDLDDTLTNDLENIKYAFKNLLKYKNEEYTDEKFSKFYAIDKRIWSDMAKGKIITPYENNLEKKVEWIRAKRFIEYYGEDKISYNDAVNANNIYINLMKDHVVSQEGVLETIKYLWNKKYRIVIATNGPIIPLKSKVNKLGITNYIDTIFSAEEIGFMKPNEKFYSALLKKLKINEKSEILFIGDDIEKDIEGGIQVGIDTCWCNYSNATNTICKPKYEIHKLEELKNVL